MSTLDPSSSFMNAASYLSKASSLSKVSSTIKLELYGLFKRVTVSPAPSTSRPSIFDMTGRAKWDAWASAGRTYPNPADAEAHYLKLARTLGWAEGATAAPQVEGHDESSEDIWDKESDESSSGGGGGLGLSVSSMARPPSEDGDDGVHAAAVSNDATRLKYLLGEADVDVNEADSNGYTPLHLACDRGNLAIVELLLGQGANPAIKDPDNLTAYELAEIAGHEDIKLLLLQHS